MNYPTLCDLEQDIFLVNCKVNGEYLSFGAGVFEREIKQQVKTLYTPPDERGNRQEITVELDPLWLDDLPRLKRNKKVRIKHG